MKNSLLRNGFYNATGGIIRIGIGIITIPILIRQLGIEEYGLWSLSSAIISVFLLAEAGLATTTTVFIAQDIREENVNSLFQTLTVTMVSMSIMATLSAILLWISADRIAVLFPDLKLFQVVEVSKAFQIGSLAVWARLLQQVFAGVEQGYQRYDMANLISVVQSLLINSGMIIIAFSGGQTVELMQWNAVTSFLILLTHIFTVGSLFRNTCVQLIWNKDKALKILKYSSMMWLTSFGCTLFSRVDRLIIGNLLGTHSLGIYAAITEVTSQINGVSALPVQPLIPLLGELSSEKNIQQSTLKRQIIQSFKTNSLIAMGLGANLVILSPICLNFLFPDRLNSTYILEFSVCSIIYSIYSTNAVGYYILIGIKEINVCTQIVSFSGVLSIFLIILGANNFGLIGSICGNSGYILTLMLPVVALRKVRISLDLLRQSLSVPVLLLLLAFSGNMLLNENIYARAAIFLIQNCAMIYWYFGTKIMMQVE